MTATTGDVMPQSSGNARFRVNPEHLMCLHSTTKLRTVPNSHYSRSYCRTRTWPYCLSVPIQNYVTGLTHSQNCMAVVQLFQKLTETQTQPICLLSFQEVAQAETAYVTSAVFKARQQNYEERLLATSCLSVCPSAWNSSAPTRRNFVKFYIFRGKKKSCREN